MIDFYGSVAKIIGLTNGTNILQDGHGTRIRDALFVDSAATTVGAVLGTSSLTIYVESGVGIAAGGRTGLTAVSCSFLMATCILVGPLLRYVPLAATTGALIYVALKLVPPLAELRQYRLVDLLAAATMQAVVVRTFALDRAMLAGFVIYAAEAIINRRKPNPFLVASAVLLLLGAFLQR